MGPSLGPQTEPHRRGGNCVEGSGSCSFLACYFYLVLDRLQDGPRGAQVAPRPPQERLKRLQEAAMGAPGGPKRSPRDPRSRSRGLKTLQDRPKRLEKNTIPKTIVHINVADTAEIDKNKTLLTPGAVSKGRAGGGVPPWGRQPDQAVNGKRRIQTLFVIIKRFCTYFFVFCYCKISVRKKNEIQRNLPLIGRS